MYILGYLGGPEGGGGGFNNQTGPILLPAILSPISMYMSHKETIWYEIFKLKPKIWKKYTFFSYLGVLWGPYVEPRWTKISGQ